MKNFKEKKFTGTYPSSTSPESFCIASGLLVAFKTLEEAQINEIGKPIMAIIKKLKLIFFIFTIHTWWLPLIKALH